MNSFGTANDEAIRLRNLLSWFLEPLKASEWVARKHAIEATLENALEPHLYLNSETQFAPVSINEDRFGWYLYLLEVTLNEPEKCEPIQGSRILPVFQRLADDFELMRQIEGIERKRGNLLSTDRGNPDSGLFEVLVGLLWKRNGWEDVAFLPETPPSKQPDLEARSKTESWNIECKRLAKSSQYSEAEREKWLRLWRPLSQLIIDRGYAVVFDIVFHVELTDLADEFLVEELKGRIALAVPPCTLVTNELWSVAVRPVNLFAARSHLRDNLVKYPSPQLGKLVAGNIDPNRAFTYLVSGKTVRIGAGPGNNRFLDKMDFAAGAYWHCDSEKSIAAKARDIRKRLAYAIEQIPRGTPSVIHIGIETLDGIMVEQARYLKIFETVSNFDLRGKDVRWVYCHLYQSYAPPDQSWVFDETVYYFGSQFLKENTPLKHTGTVVPSMNSTGPRVHWLRPPP